MQSGNYGSGGGLMQLFKGLFGNSGAPAQAGMNQLQQMMQQIYGQQAPYQQAGQTGIQNYQNMLGNMQNPSQFLNGLMGQYQESPYAKYQQQQTQTAGNNAASASGLLGSTPFLQQSQQNSQNISSADMQNWLQNALGVNSQALQGYGNMMNVGQNATNNLTNQMSQYGTNMAQLAYGQDQAENQQQQNVYGGLYNIFKNGLFG